MILAQGESKSAFYNKLGSGKLYEKLDQGKEIVMIFYDVLAKKANKLSSEIYGISNKHFFP